VVLMKQLSEVLMGAGWQTGFFDLFLMLRLFNSGITIFYVVLFYFVIIIIRCFVELSDNTQVFEVLGREKGRLFQCKHGFIIYDPFNFCVNHDDIVFSVRLLVSLAVSTGPYWLLVSANSILMLYQVCWFQDSSGFLHSGSGRIQ
jgi:hypothetical protein